MVRAYHNVRATGGAVFFLLRRENTRERWSPFKVEGDGGCSKKEGDVRKRCMMEEVRRKMFERRGCSKTCRFLPQFRQLPAELIHPFRRMYAMFTQFRYTQDLGFGIELTEPTKLLNKPFPLTTTLPRRKATLNLDLCPLNRVSATLNLDLCHRPLGRSDLGQRTLNLEP